ncbi:MAG: class I SAM-dependent methyltransferase [Abditibacteriota bacterium]|nr:class I SAM-dependent methyltransferase [Abditibacteriota bacterium]
MSGAVQYQDLPLIYDRVMSGVPYSYWLEYLQGLFERYSFRPRTLLDVACGTGTMTKAFADAGIEAAGVDISPGMIDCARSKYPGLEFVCADAAEFDMGRQFDCAVSLFDSLNYVTERDRLQQVFCRVEEHLAPGGYFIFDMNTIYALSAGLFRQADLEDWPRYIWTPSWDPKTRLCSVDMVFETREPDGSIRQFRETHVQKGYRQKEMINMLENASLTFVEDFDAYSTRKTHKRSDRIFYVARKD